MLFLLPQLAYCVVQFLEKDPTLTEPVFFIFFFFLSLLLKKQGLRLLISKYFIENCAYSLSQKQSATRFTLNFLSWVQVIRGLLKFWPKTCSQKEVFPCVVTLPALSHRAAPHAAYRISLLIIRSCSWGKLKRFSTSSSLLSSRKSRNRCLSRSLNVWAIHISR